MVGVSSRCKEIKTKGAVSALKLALAACLVLIALQAHLWAEPVKGTSEKDIRHILSNPLLEGASTGIHIVSLPDEKVLFSLNGDGLFIVASNMKLLTTAAALQFLGAEYQFKTTVYRRGDISREGILDGDIVIRGGGDPNISGRFYEGRSTAVLERWAAALSDAGIREVGGDIIADDTWFDREYVHPDWPRNQLSSWYSAPVSGLSFNDNCIELRVLSRGNGRVKIITEPNTRYVTVHNSCRVTKAKKGAKVTVHKKPGANEIFIRGEINRRHIPVTYFVTVDNPPLFLASVFKEVLEREGIKVRGRVRLIAERDRKSSLALHELTSTASTMAQSVKVANTRSQNFYAEQILKTLGMEIKGEGSFAAGLEVLREFLLELGHTPDRYRVADGSGLSRNNRLSPRMMVDILAFMYRHKDGDVFYSSLPVSGTTGTLRRRLREEPYRGRVRAKTGHIYKASSLSGYVETLSGQTLAFSILINDFNVSNSKIKHIQDSICRVLVNN
ncbi:MAG: D-alanyl-D-alanine carboxypeptidase/D-alanyl-D-alanine-endopeptidase [Candidatus Brocadiales bacterium]